MIFLSAGDLAAVNGELEAFLQGAELPHQGLRRAVAAAQREARRLDEVLIELGVVDEAAMARLRARWAGLEWIDAPERFYDGGPIFEGISAEYLRSFRMAPFRTAGGSCGVVVADPISLDAVEMLRFVLGQPLPIAVAEPKLIEDAIAKHFPAPPIAMEDADAAGDHDIARLRDSASQGPVVALAQEIMFRAVDRGASDIHIEASATGFTARYRIGGVLTGSGVSIGGYGSALVSRMKVLAQLNISERRRPQDGRIRLAVRGRDTDFRISTLPTQYGESLVLRVLDQSRVELDWSALGFSPELAAEIERITASPNGLFLVTGPTGSGKTTTLYTALQRLNKPDVKICTVEDPIEYTLPGLNQVQVHADIGYGFAEALRAILRQDPDVLMVGEIRDEATAQIAVRAALVGRMVLSTVHTNSAAEAITRLRDLGVANYLIASTLRAVLAQRLDRAVEASPGEANGRRLSTDLLVCCEDVVAEIAAGSSARRIAQVNDAKSVK